MNIWYFCANPNISLRNIQYAPPLHISATIGGLQNLGHQVQHFIYADELGLNEEKLRKTTKQLGRRSRMLRRAKPLFRDVYELYQNLARDRALIEPIFRHNSIDLVYERLFPSKSAVSVSARRHNVPLIVESNSPAGERREYWGSPLQPLFDRMEKKILQRADAVTVVSTALKRHYEAMGIAAEKIFVLPNGVNEMKFSPDNVARNIRLELGLEGKTIVGFVGNIHPYHGAELFLPIARALSHKSDDIHFLIVGGGPGRDQLQAALSREKLADRFTLVGLVPNSEVPEYIAAMDICLLPHFMWYGSPMKIFEYGAMAKAIIAPDLENIREVLDHGRTAYLFEPENVGAMTQALQELANNEQLRTQLGQSARRHILTNHTWTRNAERIIEIHHQIVS